MSDDGPSVPPTGRSDQSLIELATTTSLDLSGVRAFIEAAPIGVVVIENEIVIYSSEKAHELTSISVGDRLMDALAAVQHPWDHDRYREIIDSALNGLPRVGRVRTASDRGGHTLEIRVFPVNVRTILTVSDATEESARIRELDRFRAVADATSDLVGMASVDGTLLYMNPSARAFHGIAVDLPVSEVEPFLGIPRDQIEIIRSEGIPRLMRGEVWEGEIDVISERTGERVPFWAVWVPTRNEVGEVEVVSSTFRDLSERRRFEHRLAYAAAHDALTGLPNRERLFEVLADRAASRTPVAVLFCDLDDFKIVNDTLGHAVGDRVLRTVADRLVNISRANDVVGRLGGDEFLVVCEGVTSELEACDIADRISEAIHQPITLGGREYRITASIGISMRHGDRSVRAGDLVLEADLAMYRAKEAGRRHVELFDGAMRTQMSARLDLERELRLAIERDELEVYFQPVIDLASGRVDGFESLVRWNHPERGLLTPAAFLELSETAGLGLELGDIVLEQTCAAAARFATIDPDVQVGFNVSTSQMRSPDLAHRISSAAGRAGASMSHLVLEVTEDVVMADTEGARAMLRAIRSMGVRIAVDDFGTGYSSLAMLRRLPVDILKIDRSFVDGLGSEPEDTQIVRLVMSLADELGLVTIAEGVETDDQLAELVRLGCVLAQGYFFSHPVPYEEAFSGLRERNVSRPDHHPRRSSPL